MTPSSSPHLLFIKEAHTQGSQAVRNDEKAPDDSGGSWNLSSVSTHSQTVLCIPGIWRRIKGEQHPTPDQEGIVFYQDDQLNDKIENLDNYWGGEWEAVKSSVDEI